MIPKIIHFVWFGQSKKPDKVIEKIKNWEKMLPDYKIIEWNENNFPIDEFIFVKEAIAKQKYAFASDVVRFWAVYNYGGIYLDTDVTVLKNFDELLDNKMFLGCEDVDSINSGLSFGAEVHNSTVLDLLNEYKNVHYISNGVENDVTTNVRVTKYFLKKGYKLKNKIQVIGDTRIYPKEYFAPMQFWNGKIYITEKSYSIHEYDSSWFNKKVQFKSQKHYIVLAIRKIFGYYSFEILNNKRKK